MMTNMRLGFEPTYEDKIKILEALKRPGLHKEAVNEYLDAIIQDLLELEAIDEGK